jgi:cystathionine gamma-synthase
MQLRPYLEHDRTLIEQTHLVDPGIIHAEYSTGLDEDALGRIVAVADGKLLGYIEYTRPHGTVVNELSTGGAEPVQCGIAQNLFVADGAEREAVAAGLLDAARMSIWEQGLQPVVLAVGDMPASWGTDPGVETSTGQVRWGQEPESLMHDLVHSGIRDGGIGSVATAIEVSTTYKIEVPGQYGEFAYARSLNPTRKALEEALAVAEGGGRAMAFSSGLAAIDAVLRLLSPGESVMLGKDAYGGTWRLLDKVWRKHGIGVQIVDLENPEAVAAEWDQNTKMVMLETPSNPRMQVVDIQKIAEIAKRRGALCIVDNTFATPYLQRPLDLGADVVVHSATKYLGGHSDVVAGALITRDANLAKEFVFTQKAVGAVPGPFDSFLVLRGMRTLGVRVERQSRTAAGLAEMLQRHEKIERVYYPGLTTHPNHDVAARQMRMFGGMLSIDVKGGAEAARKLAGSCQVFALAESLGAVESLIEHPYSMTHAASNESELEVSTGLVRLSIGLEEQWILAKDLQQALAGI